MFLTTKKSCLTQASNKQAKRFKKKEKYSHRVTEGELKLMLEHSCIYPSAKDHWTWQNK